MCAFKRASHFGSKDRPFEPSKKRPVASSTPALPVEALEWQMWPASPTAGLHDIFAKCITFVCADEPFSAPVSIVPVPMC